MTSSNPPLLEARHLGRRRPDGPGWLLEDVSLDIRAGGRLVVVGPSGAGKTLLLRSLALLDPLDSGTVRWRGRVVAGDQVPAFRSQVIYLHQRSALLDDSVRSALEKPLALQVHRDRRFDRDKIVGLLRLMGRDESFLDKLSRDLSGGEIQITALLRAIQLDPCLLLLDEPTAALDTQTTLAIEALLDGWVGQSSDGRAAVWVSHDAVQSQRVGRTTLRVAAGRLVSPER
jgi:putative ABC transport system ATP-binding protein